jgi:TonB family protein
MAADRNRRNWNGNGRSVHDHQEHEHAGVALVEKPRHGTRRTITIPAGEVPPELPLTEVSESSPGWLWLKAFLGGVVLCCVLFAVLGWIQPVFKKNERIEIPSVVKLILDGGPQQKKSKKAIQKQEKRREEPRKEPKRTNKPQKIVRTQTKQVQTTRARNPLSDALSNLNTFSPIGSGVGGTIQIDFSQQDQQVAEQAQNLQDYRDRRRRIREQGANRGGRGFGDRSGMGAGMDIQMTRAEAASLPPPKYPKKALKDQVEGFVRVRLLISITGQVEKYEILVAQPEGYFEAAIEDVLPRWQFEPALDEEGRPIEFWEDYTYQFKLEDAA